MFLKNVKICLENIVIKGIKADFSIDGILWFGPVVGVCCEDFTVFRSYGYGLLFPDSFFSVPDRWAAYSRLCPAAGRNHCLRYGFD